MYNKHQIVSDCALATLRPVLGQARPPTTGSARMCPTPNRNQRFLLCTTIGIRFSVLQIERMRPTTPVLGAFALANHMLCVVCLGVDENSSLATLIHIMRHLCQGPSRQQAPCGPGPTGKGLARPKRVLAPHKQSPRRVAEGLAKCMARAQSQYQY